MPHYRDYLLSLTAKQVLARIDASRISNGDDSAELRDFPPPPDILQVGRDCRYLVTRSGNRFTIRLPEFPKLLDVRLRGTVVPDPAGSRIKTRVAMNRFGAGFLALWMLMAILGGTQEVLRFVSRQDAADKGWGEFLTTVGTFVFLSTLPIAAWWPHRNRHEEYWRFLDSLFANVPGC